MIDKRTNMTDLERQRREPSPNQGALKRAFIRTSGGLFLYPGMSITYDLLEGTRGRVNGGQYTMPFEWMQN